jgi:hypothetical protein
MDNTVLIGLTIPPTTQQASPATKQKKRDVSRRTNVPDHETEAA